MKKIIFILVFLSSLYLYGQEDCSKNTFSKKLEAASLAEIPKCKRDESKDYLDAYNEFKSYFPDSGVQIEGDVQGVKVKGSKELIAIANDILEEPGPPEWQKKVASCIDVICLLETIIGSKEAAYRIINIKMRNGYTMSLGRIEGLNIGLGRVARVKDIQIFKPEEIKGIDEAMKLFPKELKNLPGLERIYRLEDNTFLPGLETATAWAQPKHLDPVN